MKVLVIQIKMIGDVLASTVICEAIKKQHPNCEVHYLIQKNTFPVIENNPFIDKVLFFEEEKYKGLSGLFRLGIELKLEKYDTVIDVYGKFQSLIPTYLSGAKKRIGTYKWYSKLFLTETVIPDTECNGTANAFRILLAKTAIKKEIPQIFPKIHLTPSEIENAKNQIISQLDVTKKIVMISVLGSGKNKSLPDASMATVLNKIAATVDVQLVFNYMPNQQEEAKAIFDLCDANAQSKIIFDFYVKGLRGFLAVLSQCDALVGNEGGATNMSKALNIPTFTIYAPWINRTSWNIFEETGLHEIVHLSDYFPDLYKNKHPKNFKEKALEWYDKLNPELFTEKLQRFVKKISQ
ncbi:lipopolysaccharide heptosyltransferase family protein [Flavobacterium sp. LMO8]|uniref:glycosyltransferase family 9 protein n=1 Tax=Flavobacterium sp. LMO8 TaxID=2654244 RepID=UPI0012915164|nr:glycosyltransferase family 9 protein [Flavobacterium sp. LMO8]MQP24097.1 lipopolysaccharide heptosyltransferase family protein [Flavobacterium sp. LMO8]